MGRTRHYHFFDKPGSIIPTSGVRKRKQSMRKVSLSRFGIMAFLVLFTVTGCGEEWRSALYPLDWEPGDKDSQGRFLHDFSYAGYKNGEEAIPNVTGPVFNVTANGADTSGGSDSTQDIQATINQAQGAGGGVVYFPQGLYRVNGTLSVTKSNVVLRGAGYSKSRIYFTKYSGMDHKAHITFKANLSTSGNWLLSQDAKNQADHVFLSDTSGLSVGDEISLGIKITNAFRAEHAMSNYWGFSAGQWRAIFRRVITGINAGSGKVTFDVPLRYPLKTRDQASLKKEGGYNHGCAVEKLGVANAVKYKKAWQHDQVRVIDFIGLKDSWIKGVRSFNPPVSGDKGKHLQSGGIRIKLSKRITVADCRMEKGQNRGGGGNGYLYEISRSNEILTRDCTGYKGRHNFTQNWDFGTSGCVWLRCKTSGGREMLGWWDPVGIGSESDFHHALAMGNLVDSCTVDDGWSAANRKNWSSGAGHTSTQCVFWNTSGSGTIKSRQYGWGYVIGTTSSISVKTSTWGIGGSGTSPKDFVEGKGKASTLVPASLYEDQLDKRTN